METPSLERLLGALIIHHGPALPEISAALAVSLRPRWLRLPFTAPRHALISARMDPGLGALDQLLLQLMLSQSDLVDAPARRRLARLARKAEAMGECMLCVKVHPANASAHEEIEAAALAASLDGSP